MPNASNYVVGAATIVMTLATALLAFTVPSIWTMSSDIGGLKVRVEEIVRRLEGVESKLEMIGKRVDGIETRLTQRDTDPASLVAQAGLRPTTEYGGVRVGEKLFVLPKSDQANAELVASGLRREAITPSVFGFLLGTFDSSGRLVPSTTTSR